MKLFSSSTSSNPSNLTIFSPKQTPSPSKLLIPTPFKPIHSKPPFHTLSAHESSSSLQEPKASTESFSEDKDKLNEEIRASRQSLEELLVVRRPVMDSLVEDDDDDDDEEEEGLSSVDASLAKFAKKVAFFEPERVESREERPLVVNLDLALYRAKVLGRNFRYQEAEELLQKISGLKMGGLMWHLERYTTNNLKQMKLEVCMRKVARQLKEKMPTFGSSKTLS